MKSQNNFA